MSEGEPSWLDANRADHVNRGLAALLWAYTAVRAQRLSFTHDESLTYFHNVLTPLRETLLFEGRLPSNNHLLNSLLTRVAALFGTSELLLRLPNVLAHGLYLASALALARSLRTGSSRVLGFVVLTLNPFMLDFFSMCRGYGLACAFTLTALYAFHKVVEDARVRPWLACGTMLLAALSVLANLSFLVFFLSLAGTLCLAEASKLALSDESRGRDSGPHPRRKLLMSLSLQLIVVAALCAYVVPIGLKLRALGELYYGGERGFVVDTVGSLMHASAYYRHYPRWLFMLIGVLLLLTLVGALALTGQRAWRARDPRAAWSCVLPFVAALACIVQRHALGTKYPVDRTALFFIPLFGVACVAAARVSPNVKASNTVLAALALLCSLSAARGLNGRYLAQWQYDASTRRMLEDLASARGAAPVQLGVHWLFAPSVRFYQTVQKLDWLAPVDRAGLRGEFDFYYYRSEDQRRMRDRAIAQVRRYLRSHTILARRAP